MSILFKTLAEGRANWTENRTQGEDYGYHHLE